MKAAALKRNPAKAKTVRKSRPWRSHDEATVESFRTDPHFAAEYLSSVLADGDQEELMVALRYMAQCSAEFPVWQKALG